MEDASGIALIVGLLVLIYAIVTFLLPFFVLRIRNEMISMNKKITRLVVLLGDEKEVVGRNKGQASIQEYEEENLITVCPHCGAENEPDDYNCIKCGKPQF